MAEAIDIKQVKGIIRRRKFSFIVTFLFILILGLVIAFILPSKYTSQATILIENQMIPPEYVQTTITSYVEERLAAITQQIMSRTRLVEIIKRFNLYTDMQDHYTTEEIIDKMREDIHFEPQTAEIIDRRTGRPTAATIYFTLSYEGENPSVVQKVANVLSSLYLELNLQSRERLASNTTVFLEQEQNSLNAQIEELQKKISEFKEQHLNELPEYNVVNLQAVSRFKSELERLNLQINSLKERKILLEGQLSNLDPLKPIVNPEGKSVMNPNERLKYLRLQLLSLQSNFSDKHPDIKRLKKEIQELEAQVENPDASQEKIKHYENLKTQLAELNGKLGPKHPDVIQLKKEIEAFSREIDQIKEQREIKSLSDEQPDNPAYINIKTQIASTDVEIAGLLENIKQVKGEISLYENRIANAPSVESEYNTLLRDYETARAKYSELTSKLMAAKVAQGMEETQRGERFTIIDPPQLPEKPSKPNRLAIGLISFVLALGGGIGLAAVKETTDSSIKMAEELKAITAAPVMASIPLLRTAEDRKRRLIKIILILAGLAVIILLGLYIMNQFIMPLDVLWAKLQRKFLKMQAF